MLIHSQSSRESFPGLCKNYAARKRVFSVSLRFAPFILPVFMGWGKRQIPLISPWLASVILQNFELPHPFPSNSKQCREFSPAQGQRSQFIPLYSPTYSPGWPGVLPQGQADDMCIRRTNLPPLENCHVCSEHFLPSCFEPDLRAQLTGQTGKRSLRADAIPSVFKYSHSPEEKIPKLSSERCLGRQRHEEVSLSSIKSCPELCYINGLV